MNLIYKHIFVMNNIIIFSLGRVMRFYILIKINYIFYFMFILQIKRAIGRTIE